MAAQSEALRFIFLKAEELTKQQLYAILALRFEVFGTELNMAYPDLDFKDLQADTWHHWVETTQGDIVSYLRLVKETSNSPYRIAKVVTRKAYRGQGLSGQLLQETLKRFERPLILYARSHLKNWYAGFGFVVTGEPFTLYGCIEHYPMILSD